MGVRRRTRRLEPHYTSQSINKNRGSTVYERAQGREGGGVWGDCGGEDNIFITNIFSFTVITYEKLFGALPMLNIDIFGIYYGVPWHILVVSCGSRHFFVVMATSPAYL